MVHGGRGIMAGERCKREADTPLVVGEKETPPLPLPAPRKNKGKTVSAAH
jgi:hypothetical protein